MAHVFALKVHTITPLVAAQLNGLLCQVRRDKNIYLTAKAWRRIVGQNNLRIFVIRQTGSIVAMGTLRWHELAGRRTALLEDLVVDAGHRGKGLARVLVEKLARWARHQGIARIDATSGPDRRVANAFYKKLGLVKRDTNVYRLSL